MNSASATDCFATARIAAAFFAAAVVTVRVVSPFGLAGRHRAQAGAVLAGQPASGLMALAPVQRAAG
jgi:hypothetical protein